MHPSTTPAARDDRVREEGAVTAPAQAYSEQFVEAAGGRIHLLRGGTGRPALVLHHDTGNPGWLPFYEALAAHADVLVPEQPGHGQSDHPAWMRSVRDLAAVYQWLLADLGLEDVSLMGLGFGGWVAAEMAALAPRQFRRLVLVGAMGLQPERGEIFDQALVNHIGYFKQGLHNKAVFEQVFGEEPPTDQLEAWEISRETTFRIAWRPYMYSQTLPHLLGGVRTPALVVWGREDGIVPLECGQAYARLLPNARLEIIERCGHFADLEQPEALAKLISSFLAG
jgi:pimeloyl-ACP methyl ester carboxylesterase